MSIIRKITSYLILILAFFLVVGLVKDIWRLMHADERIHKAEKQLTSLKKENQQLAEKLDYYQSDQFLEEQIRDKLQMAKPGEKIVILPEDLGKVASEGQKFKKENQQLLPNWKKWLELFL